MSAAPADAVCAAFAITNTIVFVNVASTPYTGTRRNLKTPHAITPFNASPPVTWSS